jgi:hypothetical protein
LPSVQKVAPNVLPEAMVENFTGFLQPGAFMMSVGPGVMCLSNVSHQPRA